MANPFSKNRPFGEIGGEVNASDQLIVPVFPAVS